MPRKLELTWIAGSDGRTGRWRKKYRGVQYYFPGTTKKDVAAYDRALAQWEAKKREIDAAAFSTPLHLAYGEVIKTWTDVVAWSVAHGDETIVDVARSKLADLQTRVALPSPPPLTSADYFRQHVTPPTPPRSLPPSETIVTLEADDKAFTPDAVLGSPVTDEKIFEGMAAKGHAQPLIWGDRLETMNRKRTPSGEDVAGRVDAYLAKRRLDVELGNLAAGRYDFVRVQLVAFRDWIGGAESVKAITAATVANYHAELSKLIVSKKLSASYAKDRFNEFRAFVRWLWSNELIPALPRNLDDAGLRINKGHAQVETIEVETVNRLIAGASDRTRLYLLLMLNCGMTQKDISDLKPAEVDLVAGTITRKRSKTSDHENVPTVRYRLWAETLRLLKQEQAEQGDRVLLNDEGGELKVERIGDDGRLVKIDNVKSAFSRLCVKLKIKASLIELKKTSATLIRSRKEFSGLEALFLGHAPTSMSDRHYTKAPQELLDEALAWLGKQYVTTPDKKPTKKT